MSIDNQSSFSDLDFYNSSQYKDMYAKENLNLLNQWEQVIIIENKSSVIDFMEANRDFIFEDVALLPVRDQWIRYFNLD